MSSFPSSKYAHYDTEVCVVAIFTKFDGLVTMAFSELREKLGIKDAREMRVDRAQEKLNADFIGPLMATKCPPAGHVRLDG